MKKLKVGLFILMSMIIVLSSVDMIAAVNSTQRLNTADVEKFLDAVINEEMEAFNIPNLTVSVVADGEIVLTKGYGFKDIEKRIPVDPDKTLFRIGSTSKLFTWTAIMQLVEEGKLDLDVDVNEYLDFEIPSQLEYGSKRQELKQITIRHLMNHTPGFEDRMSQIFTLQEEELLPLYQYVRENRPARVFPPGEVTAYSNYGTSLAGYIVEVVSGVPFPQYVEENIYRPLNIKNSSFRQPLPENLANNMSKPYRYVDGAFREAKFEFMSEPAGSMSSTASDMAKFMLAYLQGGKLKGESILMEETVSEIFSEPFTFHPHINGMAHGFIKTTFNGRDTFHHGGGTMLYDTGFYLLRKKKLDSSYPIVGVAILQI